MGGQSDDAQASAHATLMKIKWADKALSDVAPLYEFLATVNQPAAASVVQALTDAPTRLLSNSRLGEKLEEFAPREVRRILVGQYEMRYEIAEQTIYVLPLWHTREDL